MKMNFIFLLLLNLVLFDGSTNRLDLVLFDGSTIGLRLELVLFDGSTNR